MLRQSWLISRAETKIRNKQFLCLQAFPLETRAECRSDIKMIAVQHKPAAEQRIASNLATQPWKVEMQSKDSKNNTGQHLNRFLVS